ncbi:MULTISPECIES: L-ribulose-5-phosphate 4-epimerase [unclassified Alteromonas]|uniref:L-ribulose-5-phosphate 4-epimerase n=1 Tax=unclassified Alteromonas TaxID=2614992 RepID=UPI000C687903|nr:MULTISPECIES: L-ribulose-5-phosphate 4-epimerase [unclassified Alteromonas]AYA66192.1 L-ribulose-5-phosphate 4-epimerase [Alteromonas sp. RKMC-009]MBT79653.1 L-ribulose-5-phosphate 4-epimerase [Alteromonadaceae bacterium]MDO6474164.1 L-ribulose-5-phosphate 4-epimerase [Alteromonas sp. 1_MG-2023]MEC7691527.1 L-ribulose-5-phosphate 4-epimerase [Pseudomonadota bacterium]
MSYKELKREVFEANMELQRRNLVIYTFGNVSQIDRDKGVVAIKPSGVAYEDMKPEDIVVVDLENNIVEGTMRPSSDTKTHTHLYRAFDSIGGVTHTHSTYATAWAQAKQSIPCLGTTHADYVYGDITCTRELTDEQVNGDYEEETGVQITDAYADRDPAEAPMVIVAGHAPFTWGKSAAQSVYHAALLEEIARMAYLTRTLDQNAAPLKRAVMDKHYLRKHGKNAYYGQS